MTSTQSTELQAVLFLAIIIWRLVRKMQERPVKTDAQRWRLPLILTAIGGFETVSLTRGAHPITLTSADLGYLVAVSAVSVVLGLIRGTTIRIQDRGGMLTQKYTGLTVGLWLGTVAVRLGLDVGASHAFGVASAVTGTSILMMFGLSLLGESAAVALRTGGYGGPAGRGGFDGTGLGRGGYGGYRGYGGNDGGEPEDRIPADRLGADRAGGRGLRAERPRFDRPRTRRR
jgi:hypothetical protein